jgi:hypothetical protein
MGAKVKPVQPTVIKDKKVVREVIEQIRRKPTPATLKRHKEQEEALIRLLKKRLPAMTETAMDGNCIRKAGEPRFSIDNLILYTILL